MKPSDCLSASPSTDKKTLELSVRVGDNMIFHGSTLLTAATVGSSDYTTLTFVAPEREQNKVDLICVSVYARQSWHTFLIKVAYRSGAAFEDDGAWVFLCENYIPNDGRVVVMDYSGIRTLIDGVIYTTEQSHRPNGSRHVPDPKVLLLYLACDVEADQVQAAAEDQEIELELREMVARGLPQRLHHSGAVSADDSPVNLLTAAIAELEFLNSELARTRQFLDPESLESGTSVSELASWNMENRRLVSERNVQWQETAGAALASLSEHAGGHRDLKSVAAHVATRHSRLLLRARNLAAAVEGMSWRGKPAADALRLWKQDMQPAEPNIRDRVHVA